MQTESAGAELGQPRREVEQSIASALLRDLLARNGWANVRSVGDSMRRAVPPGSLLRVERVPAGQLATGDVVCFESHGRLVAHRLHLVIGVLGGWLFTIGDANPLPDPPVPCRNVLGRVTALRLADDAAWIPVPPSDLPFLRLRRILEAALRRLLGLIGG